jgi:hypothetical protein
MKTEQNVSMHPARLINRTSSGLRDALFQEWDSLNNGSSNPKMATAKAGLAKQIINSVKVEIEFVSHVRSAQDGQINALSAPINLSEGAS